jgi:hypothetical protein
MRPEPFAPARLLDRRPSAQRSRDIRFWHGLAVALPLSLALWALILWAVDRVFGGAQ